MQLDFWLDPACPWCWLTSRWVVDVAPHRDVQVTWRPISLKVKNQVTPESGLYERVTHTHNLLRVIEAVRAGDGEAPIGNLYTVIGQHIHDGGEPTFSAAAALAEAGLSGDYASAYDDEQWDAVIATSMAEGLAMTGDDVGTPILGFDSSSGQRVGFFGPVVSRRLPQDQALDLFDGLMLMGRVDAFWELKRTRTASPDFTPVD